MELKYYLRGLGIGIAMTAIIMGIALSGKRTMTDEEIIARAKELGMVENTVLLNATDDAAQEDADDVSGIGQDIAEQPQEDDVAGSTAPDQDDAAAIGSTEQDRDDMAAVDDTEADPDDMTPDEDTAPDRDDVADDSAEEDGETDSETESDNANETITSAALKTITIKGGEGSYTVAKKLEDVGVVTSAANFDTFLCEHGYDKRLRTGTFSIPADASDEQIARIITGAE